MVQRPQWVPRAEEILIMVGIILFMLFLTGFAVIRAVEDWWTIVLKV